MNFNFQDWNIDVSEDAPIEPGFVLSNNCQPGLICSKADKVYVRVFESVFTALKFYNLTKWKDKYMNIIRAVVSKKTWGAGLVEVKHKTFGLSTELTR